MELNHFVLILSLYNSLALGVLWLFYRREKRKILSETLPSLIQNVLNDVGASISEQINVNFSKPAVSKAMGIIGKQSGRVRADAALQNKVADKIMEQSPVISKALEYFDITPMEGLLRPADGSVQKVLLPLEDLPVDL